MKDGYNRVIDIILDSYHKTRDSCVDKSVFSNIVITGGNSMIKTFEEKTRASIARFSQEKVRGLRLTL